MGVWGVWGVWGGGFGGGVWGGFWGLGGGAGVQEGRDCGGGLVMDTWSTFSAAYPNKTDALKKGGGGGGVGGVRVSRG